MTLYCFKDSKSPFQLRSRGYSPTVYAGVLVLSCSFQQLPPCCGLEHLPPSVDSSTFLLLWTPAASTFCGFEQFPPSVSSNFLLWFRATSSFCGLEQLPPSAFSSDFLLLWFRATSSFCGFDQHPVQNLNIVIRVAPVCVNSSVHT